MKTADLKKIRKSMEKELDAKRYEHTLGVAYTAAALAMCNDVDPVKAETAGLLHDCAKCFSDDKKISVCRKNNMEINSVESRNPYLLHAKIKFPDNQTTNFISNSNLVPLLGMHRPSV